MIVRKITSGYVCQVIDSVTGKLISQDFVCEDSVYEDEDCEEILDSKEIAKIPYFSYTMGK